MASEGLRWDLVELGQCWSVQAGRDIVEMLHGPIYIGTEMEWLATFNQKRKMEQGMSKVKLSELISLGAHSCVAQCECCLSGGKRGLLVGLPVVFGLSSFLSISPILKSSLSPLLINLMFYLNNPSGRVLRSLEFNPALGSVRATLFRAFLQSSYR
ncbi:hypothetical protein QYF36_006022 [Acer negundo]|nr:hypothetical protein QYF36_006022 [Acer negundo]